MADETFDFSLPADLPENWEYGQVVAPSGADAGLPEQYGYNYLNKQVNNTQKAVNQLGTNSYTCKQVDDKLAQKSSTGHTHDDRYYTESEIDTKLTGKANTSHTHSYAGSSSAGGSANSAVKLDSSAGSATKPVYFSGGKPVACTYSLNKDVPSNAVFTDHTYTNMTAATASAAGKAGLVPAPAASAQTKFLRGDGTWQAVVTSSLSAYPVGSIYQSTSSTSPASLFGGTWEQIASERVLMGASSTHAAGSTVEAGLPNITGEINKLAPSSTYALTARGAFSISSDGYARPGDYVNSDSYTASFDASRSSAIYGKSTTVQPAAYYVYIWRRVS